MITVHHLDYSRSTRVLWFLEELGLEYEVVRYRRKAGGPAPAELSLIHPLGKSPVIVDDGFMLAESSAILRYLDQLHGHQRFSPTDVKRAALHDEWIDFVEGSAALPVLLLLVGGNGLPDSLRKFATAELAKVIGHVSGALATAPYLMGDRLTLADIQIGYILAIASANGFITDGAILSYLDRLQARPALARAIERGGPMTPAGSAVDISKKDSNMKKVLGIYGNLNQHWVGDGFPVRSLFSYNTLGQQASPFLLLDYAAPTEFQPSVRARGVGTHPHRGFETVTIVYAGEVAHRDSTGSGGTIGPGDVQWMTAGSGIVHQEFHSPAFTQQGGTLEMVQLWVNLPAQYKMAQPRYQSIVDKQIPIVMLHEGAGQMRLIAGSYDGRIGPAQTFSPVNVWDVRLHQGRQATFSVPVGHTVAVVVLHGTVQVGGESVRESQIALLEREEESVHLHADSEAVVLLLSGEPLNEPIVGHGPFVMNTREEIGQAIDDFSAGRFGRVAA